MAKVIWTDQALAQVEAIHAYILRSDSQAANRLLNRLIEAGDGLRDFPRRGRPVGRDRQLSIVPPYLIRYSVHGDTVHVISVRHGARAPLDGDLT